MATGDANWLNLTQCVSLSIRQAEISTMLFTSPLEFRTRDRLMHEMSETKINFLEDTLNIDRLGKELGAHSGKAERTRQGKIRAVASSKGKAAIILCMFISPLAPGAALDAASSLSLWRSSRMQITTAHAANFTFIDTKDYRNKVYATRWCKASISWWHKILHIKLLLGNPQDCA